MAVEVVDPARIRAVNGEAAGGGPSHLFRFDVHEASTVALHESGTSIVITTWTPDGGVRRRERA